MNGIMNDHGTEKRQETVGHYARYDLPCVHIMPEKPRRDGDGIVQEDSENGTPVGFIPEHLMWDLRPESMKNRRKPHKALDDIDHLGTMMV